MRSRRLTSLVTLFLVLMVPSAGALAAGGPVSITYAEEAHPLLVGLGRLGLTGEAASGLVVGGLQEARMGPIPTLTVAQGDEDSGFNNETLHGVTVVLHWGGLVWTAPDGAAIALRVATEYGLLLAMPLDTQAGGSDGPDSYAPVPRLLLLGRTLQGEVTWRDGPEATLVPLRATVSILDDKGNPLAAWWRREVNPVGGDRASGVVLLATGAFTARVTGTFLGAAAPSGPGLALALAPSSYDGFAEVMALRASINPFEGTEGSDSAPDQGPDLSAFSSFSTTFNGALLLLSPPGGGDATPREARIGEEASELGPFTVLRGGALSVAWSKEAFQVQGQPALAFAGDGFVAAPTQVVGPVPLVSALLWAAAAVAIVLFVALRPEATPLGGTVRLTAFLVHLAALVGAFVVWDFLFADAFGTSLMRGLPAAMEGGTTGWTVLGAIAALQLVPWMVALVLFALPVRIVLGVGLRIALRGKGSKGFAKAGGLVALAVATPVYALWTLNRILEHVRGFFPDFGA